MRCSGSARLPTSSRPGRGAGPALVDTLRDACEAALPRPKRPTRVYLVQELPLGPTGKVARRRLRDQAAAAGAPQVRAEDVAAAS